MLAPSLDQPMPPIHSCPCSSAVVLPSPKCSRRKDSLPTVSAQTHARSSPFGEKEGKAAALQFGLHFVPLIEESYFLACLAPNIHHPAVDRLRDLLAGPRWRGILADLPGYRPPDAPGSVLVIEDVLPWWRRTNPR